MRTAEHFLKATERGNAKALYRITVKYWQWEGVEQDYAKAMKWFLKATEKEYIAEVSTAGKTALRDTDIA